MILVLRKTFVLSYILAYSQVIFIAATKCQSPAQFANECCSLNILYKLRACKLLFPDKKTTCQCRGCKRHAFDPWVRKIPGRRTSQPTLVFLLGESMDKGAWQTTVHRVAESQSQLKQLNIQHVQVTLTVQPQWVTYSFCVFRKD